MNRNLRQRLLAAAVTAAAAAAVLIPAASSSAAPGNGKGKGQTTTTTAPTTTTTAAPFEADPAQACVNISGGNDPGFVSTSVPGVSEFRGAFDVVAPSCPGALYQWTIASTDGSNLQWASEAACATPSPSACVTPGAVTTTSADGSTVTVKWIGDGSTTQYGVAGLVSGGQSAVKINVETFAGPTDAKYADSSPDFGGFYTVTKGSAPGYNFR